MTRYWLKIVLGALLIFAIGMAGWLAVRKGVSTAHTVLETASPITIPLKIVDFRVDGAVLGRLEWLTLMRTAPKVISSAEVSVRVDSAAALDRLRGCAMRIDNLEHIDEHTTFVCVPVDSAAADSAFVGFGTVTVQQTDVVMPLLLPAATVRDLRREGWPGADSMPAQPEPPTPPAVPAPQGAAPES